MTTTALRGSPRCPGCGEERDGLGDGRDEHEARARRALELRLVRSVLAFVDSGDGMLGYRKVTVSDRDALLDDVRRRIRNGDV